MSAQGPTISDEWIAERWPDQDPSEVRRRFEALMDKLGETPWRGVPRYPEVMQPVLAWAAMLPSERIEVLTAALADVPQHFRDYLYVASKPAFGEQSVKYMNVAGDDGHGMGKQAVAITPYVKGYNIAPWIAATSPGNVGALLAELHELRKDKARLDFLDQCNERLNAHCGTNYHWALILNHNVNRLMLGHLEVDLHDSDAGNKGLPSCRLAIDARMGEVERKRAEAGGDA